MARHREQNLSAVDGEVAGAVDGDEEMGEGGREGQLGAPDVTTWIGKIQIYCCYTSYQYKLYQSAIGQTLRSWLHNISFITRLYLQFYNMGL